MTSPLLNQPGAVEASGPDAGVALHYGKPVAEARALEAGQAVVDLSHFDVVRVSGPDRLSWLDTLSSQRVNDLQPGEGSELLLLDPHGHIEYAAALVDDGAAAWLIVDSGLGEGLAGFLDRMRFMLRVEVDQPDVVVLGALNGGSRLLARDGEQPPVTWRDPWPQIAEQSTSYVTAAATEHPGGEHQRELVILPADQLASLRERDGLQLAGTWAWEAARIAAWRPRQATEVDERSIPHELDWLRTAVHLDKGCYRGQETIARVINLGKPPRRLVFLHLDGSVDQLPEPGAEILAGTRTVGRVTSVARHHELGPIALAVIKRATDPDVDLSVILEDPSDDGEQTAPTAPVAPEDRPVVAAAQEVIVSPEGTTPVRPATRPGAGMRNPAFRPPNR